MADRVLITGATGFVGSHAAEAYLQAGWRVRALVRDSARATELLRRGVELAKGDITDEDSVQSALDNCNVVVHCAGLTKALSRAEYFRSNAEATQSLVRASSAAGVRRFVYCSSQAASRPSTADNPVNESDRPEPVTDYGRSKLEGEQRVRSDAGRMDWVILRPSAVMGPRDLQFLPLFRLMYHYHICPVLGNGEQQYSIVYVKDLAGALLLCGQTDRAIRDTYFVAHPDPLRWSDAASIFERETHRKVSTVRIPVPLVRVIGTLGEKLMRLRGKPALLSQDKLQEIFAIGWVCSSAKLERELGYRCETTHEQMLLQTLEFYREAGML